jgi:hypothetical protein
VSDIAALVGAADQLLDAGVREIEQRAVGPDLGTPFSSTSSFSGLILVLLAMNLRNRR